MVRRELPVRQPLAGHRVDSSLEKPALDHDRRLPWSKLSTGITLFRLPERNPSRSSVTNLKPRARKAGISSPRTSSSTRRGRSSRGTSIRARSPLW